MTTAEFCGTPGAYVRRVAIAWAGRWWWTMAIPVGACLIASAFRPVWIFVALMILCLLVPAVIAMVYYNYALSPEALQTLARKTVTVGDDGLTVTLTETGKTVRYLRRDIRAVEDTGKTIVVKLRRPQYHHLAIPVDAIPAEGRDTFVAALIDMGKEMA